MRNVICLVVLVISGLWYVFCYVDKDISFLRLYNWRSYSNDVNVEKERDIISLYHHEKFEKLKDRFRCYWEEFEQELTHFKDDVNDLGDHGRERFKQRVYICEPKNKDPPKVQGLKPSSVTNGVNLKAILLYCGNESPVELYINNTGLMFELEDYVKEIDEDGDIRIQTALIFIEHRFFGKSFPNMSSDDPSSFLKLKYLSSKEAIADYAAFLNHFKRTKGYSNWPVISFGGSYGGMLSAWIRYKYPTDIFASVASSAPVLGFAWNERNQEVDATARFISKNFENINETSAMNYLVGNMLFHVLATNKDLAKSLVDKLNICEEDMKLMQQPEKALTILENIQQVLFFISEGNYNFPTDYITSVTLNTNEKLPPWPLLLGVDFLDSRYGVNVSTRTGLPNLSYTIEFEDYPEVFLQATWNETSLQTVDGAEVPSGEIAHFLKKTKVLDLLDDYFKIFELFYNVSGSLQCLELANMTNPERIAFKRNAKDILSADHNQKKVVLPLLEAWGVITCNDGIYFTPLLAQGLGNDIYWPSTISREFLRSDGSVNVKALQQHGLDYCKGYQVGKFNYSRHSLDFNNTFIKEYYGGWGLLDESSRIIFTNGGYDPWTTAGVDDYCLDRMSKENEYIYITEGAHHSELFFQNETDPVSVKLARAQIALRIVDWLRYDSPTKEADQMVET